MKRLIKDESKCIGCGACIEKCSAGAIFEMD